VVDNFFSVLYTYRTLSFLGLAVWLCSSGRKILKYLSQPNGLKTKTSPQASTDGAAAVGDNFFY
jgi:hypothetical protein